MQLAVITSIDDRLYSNSKPLAILTKFLTDDIGFRKIDSIINWIKDDSYSSMILNACYLVKYNEKIRIYFFYDGYEKEEHEKRIFFETSKDQLIELIQKWSNDYINASRHGVIITVENGIINFDPRKEI